MKNNEPSLARPLDESRHETTVPASDRNPCPTTVRASRDAVIYPLQTSTVGSRARLDEEPVRERLHDIMSPLNAVSGYVDLLQISVDDPGDVERLKRYSQKIANGLEQISNQLEELQSFCREQGGFGARQHEPADRTGRKLYKRMSGVGV